MLLRRAGLLLALAAAPWPAAAGDGADADVDVGHAAEAAEAAETGLAPRYTAFGQGLLYGSALSPADSRFNPDNALARLPRRQADAELRVNLNAKLAGCGASAKLRAQYSRRIDDATTPADSHETFLNEGGLRCRLGDQAEFGVGREVLQWGSSYFLSPSNPFFTETGKTNPIQELYGKDIWQLQWFPAPGLTLAALRNFRHGRLEADPASFSPTSAVKLDWIGDDASAGAIVSRRANGVRRLGLYGTLPVSKAALVYADLSAGRGNAGWYVQPDGTFAQGKLGDNKLYHSLLAGASYTVESGWTWTVEWLNGNEGYGAGERKAYETTAALAAQAWRRQDAGSAAAAQTLGRALAPNLPYLSRNYLFVQLLRTEWHDKGDVALRWAQPLGGGRGGAASGSLTYYLSNHHQLFLIASLNVGGDRSDFGRLLTSSLQAGIRSTF
ncbi:hypothetical protein [Duganella rhizosphaerae]|uniref:hypothetical protein n=1 Tax=Duganella rhizosphaerae TaxID=2885763 RepID=UPI00403F587A